MQEARRQRIQRARARYSSWPPSSAIECTPRAFGSSIRHPKGAPSARPPEVRRIPSCPSVKGGVLQVVGDLERVYRGPSLLIWRPERRVVVRGDSFSVDAGLFGALVSKLEYARHPIP